MPSRQEKRNELLNWVAAHAESGLSVQDYCWQADISVAKFYYWRRQLAEQDGSPDGFVSIALDTHTTPTEWAKLRLPGGLEITGLPTTQLIEMALELDRRYAELQ